MPVSGIGSGSQNYGVASTPANARNQTYSSSGLTRDLHEVRQSEYGFSRGHQRQKAGDFCADEDSVSGSTITLVDKRGSGVEITLKNQSEKF